MPWSDVFCCLSAPVDDVLELDFGHQQLNDVPAQVFASERTLQILRLESNRIAELPRALFHCHELTFLDLSDNQLKTMPPAIASLINLQHLNLSRNGLRDIPDNIKCCKQLTYLDMSLNPLEKLPDGFTQLISLEKLLLSDTYLEFLPANFGRLSKLKVLDLSDNNLNTLPKSMARLVLLEELDIGRNEFSDLPEVIGKLQELKDLLVDSNKIRFIPAFFGNLRRLQSLDISNNNIQWVAPEIEDCVGLSYVVLSSNNIQALPEEIGNLKELTFLKLDENSLSTLPASIGKLTNLEELVINDNSLQQLPPTIGLLRKLEILIADDNRLAQLPSELCSCSNLHILSVRNNLIESLPSEMGHLTNVRVINICDNRLRNLPVSVLDLRHLSALWLSANQSTPLTTLQQEMDPVTGKMVLVSIMFPQISRRASSSTEGDGEDVPLRSKPQRPHIRFAENADLRLPSPLTRAPTPYPKELRSMAKHARILATRPAPASTAPLLAVTVKTASVVKPSTASEPFPPADQATANIMPAELNQTPQMEEGPQELSGSEMNVTYTVATTEVKVMLEADEIPAGPSVLEDTASLDQTLVASPPFGGPKFNGFQRQNVMDLSDFTNTTYIVDPEDSTRRFNDTVDRMNYTNMGEFTPEKTQSNGEEKIEQAAEPVKQPPPYHIAAVYSKQAAFFRDPIASPTAIPLESEIKPLTDVAALSGCNAIEEAAEMPQEEMSKPSPYTIAEGIENGGSEDVVDSKEQSQKTEVPICRIPKLTPSDVVARIPVKSVESKIPSLAPRETKPAAVNKPSRMLQPGFHSPAKPEPPVEKPEPAKLVKDNAGAETFSAGASFKSRIPSLVPSGKVASSNSMSPPSPSWVFGQHKNPTVCPVMIVKNPGLGFTIGGGVPAVAKGDLTDGTGIFVTKVQPGGPASGLLKPGDKILQVDGIDFAKVNHDHAVEVLKQTKNVVHMMISRQK